MAGRRLIYLTVLSGCGIFYIAYGEWFSYLALMLVLMLPWLSLLLSLPAMLSLRIRLEGTETMPMGAPGQLWLQGSSRLPLPPFRGRILLTRCFTGERFWYDSAAGLPAEHCGGLIAAEEKCAVCDYLGLISLPVKSREPRIVRIRPQAVPIPVLPELDKYLARAWRPKSGGGFAENHEIRPYRPGDNLNQIHWKLTAKTGKWMLREPMEPQRGLVLVTMELTGTPEELDRKFGRLVWLGQHLLEKGLPFQLRVLTGNGIQTMPVADESQLQRQIDDLLCAPAAESGSLGEREFAASWHYHIGGDVDET